MYASHFGLNSWQRSHLSHIYIKSHLEQSYTSSRLEVLIRGLRLHLLCEQQRLLRDCANVHAHQSIRCLLLQEVPKLTQMAHYLSMHDIHAYSVASEQGMPYLAVSHIKNSWLILCQRKEGLILHAQCPLNTWVRSYNASLELRKT